MAAISLTVGALLSPLAVHAGTYVWQTTDPNTGAVTAQSPTFSGGQWFSGYYSLPGPYPYESSSGGTGTGDSSGQTDSSGDLTATFTWQPATGQTSTSDPPTSCIVKSSSTAYWIGQGPFNAPPSCSDGLGDPEINGRSSGTHYSVEVPNNGVITKKLSGAYAHISPVNVYSGSFGSTVEWEVSIVNGNWDGPYYFHYGSYSGGPVSTDGPWPNNTAGPTPEIGDEHFDKSGPGSNLFHLTDNGTSECLVEGTVTPVWFWNGPDLGVAPPGFSISVFTDAFCSDDYSPYTQAEVSDGLENTDVTPRPNTQETRDTDTRSVMVQSDVYAPGEGNGYWALGPTINLKAKIDQNPVTGDLSLDGSVVLTASILGPSN